MAKKARTTIVSICLLAAASIVSLTPAVLKVWAGETSTAVPTAISHSRHKANSKRAVNGSTTAEREHGRALFQAYGCFDCHKINGNGCKDGIDLSNVGSRRTQIFLKEQIKDPEGHVKKNKRAFDFDTSVMADADLSSQEIGTIVVYLSSLKAPLVKTDRSKHTNR